MTRLMLALAAAALAAAPAVIARGADSVKFAVIGDYGNGSTAQYEVGTQMHATRSWFPFEFVVTVGDNFYGSQSAKDRIDKFERPYAALLGAGVPFYATIGNHDDTSTPAYLPFNMGGRRYYTFTRGSVRFFVLDTNLMDKPQLAWFEQELGSTSDPWRIAVFHHPLYSNARRHGSAVQLRVLLEPLLVKHDVDVVLSGHEHVYERITPQKGITYFTVGSSGQLRKGDVAPGADTAASYDADQAFLIVDVTDTFTFQTITRTGRVIDRGAIAPRPKNGGAR
jgi:3',5'-cyclic AMP phosphodiesterase CpdA